MYQSIQFCIKKEKNKQTKYNTADQVVDMQAVSFVLTKQVVDMQAVSFVLTKHYEIFFCFGLQYIKDFLSNNTL